jgi:hypothetical protein
MTNDIKYIVALVLDSESSYAISDPDCMGSEATKKLLEQLLGLTAKKLLRGDLSVLEGLDLPPGVSLVPGSMVRVGGGRLAPVITVIAPKEIWEQVRSELGLLTF